MKLIFDSKKLLNTIIDIEKYTDFKYDHKEDSINIYANYNNCYIENELCNCLSNIVENMPVSLDHLINLKVILEIIKRQPIILKIKNSKLTIKNLSL